MSDVALRAGVSRMTVSRFFGRPGSVAPATRVRVQGAIEELGYVPPALARRVASRDTGLMALVLTDVTNPFFTQVARGVEDVAQRSGYAVVLCNSDEKVDKERRYLEALLSHQIDGVILVPASNASRENLQLLERRSIPFVLCDRRIPAVRADLVLGDSVGGARRLTEHLLEQGYRRIAFVGGNPAVSTARDRRAGYEQAMAGWGLSVDRRLVVELGYRAENGMQAVAELHARGVAFDAIVAANNAIASGVVSALRERRARIPEDVAIACFDEIEALAAIYPFFTVMTQPALNFGTLAAQMLVERMQGRAPSGPREVVLVPELVVRASSGRPHRPLAGAR
jgi:LacI family transcriptional regulator